MNIKFYNDSLNSVTILSIDIEIDKQKNIYKISNKKKILIASCIRNGWRLYTQSNNGDIFSHYRIDNKEINYA